MCKHLSKHCIKIANTLLGAIAICFCHVKESVLCTFADYILGFFVGMGPTAGGSTRKDSFDISKVSLSEEVSKDSEVSVHKVSPMQWMTMAVLVYVNLINYMDRSTVAGMLEHIKQDKDFNITHDKYLGLLQTAFVVCYMIFAPVFGYFGDRYNRKLLLTVGISFWSLSTL